MQISNTISNSGGMQIRHNERHVSRSCTAAGKAAMPIGRLRTVGKASCCSTVIRRRSCRHDAEDIGCAVGRFADFGAWRWRAKPQAAVPRRGLFEGRRGVSCTSFGQAPSPRALCCAAEMQHILFHWRVEAAHHTDAPTLLLGGPVITTHHGAALHGARAEEGGLPPLQQVAIAQQRLHSVPLNRRSIRHPCDI